MYLIVNILPCLYFVKLNACRYGISTCGRDRTANAVQVYRSLRLHSVIIQKVAAHVYRCATQLCFASLNLFLFRWDWDASFIYFAYWFILSLKTLSNSLFQGCNIFLLEDASHFITIKSLVKEIRLEEFKVSELFTVFFKYLSLRLTFQLLLLIF